LKPTSTALAVAHFENTSVSFAARENPTVTPLKRSVNNLHCGHHVCNNASLIRKSQRAHMTLTFDLSDQKMGSQLHVHGEYFF